MRLHHRVDGPDGGPLIVLGPSMGTTTELWAPQVPALTAAGLRVLRYDLPGHGGSPGVAETTLDEVAAAVVDLTGGEPFAYAGVSAGGAIGMLLAAAHPDRVTRLVLCCTAARFGEPGPWRERAALVLAGGTGPVADVIAPRWFTPAFRGAEAYVAMLRAADPRGYAAMCEAIAGYDARDRLPLITAPTLVIAGTEDPTTPPSVAAEIQAGIPAADLLVLKHAAHLATAERPGAVTTAILGVLA